MNTRPLSLLMSLLLWAGVAYAHHSFAVFFDSNKIVSISGTVTEFKFANPHGTIALNVKNKAGKTEVWKAETNAPSLLRRLGWTKESLKAGEQVTIEGWLARDGSNYLRMRKVTRADGTLVGKPIGFDTASGTK
jgi:hypothetical protein